MALNTDKATNLWQLKILWVFLLLTLTSLWVIDKIEDYRARFRSPPTYRIDQRVKPPICYATWESQAITVPCTGIPKEILKDY